MTPTTAIYLRQSSNSSGGVEEWMNVEVYRVSWEGIERLWYFISSPKVEFVILILQSTGREEINIAFVTINSESLLRCGTNNMTLSAGWVGWSNLSLFHGVNAHATNRLVGSQLFTRL